MTDQWRDIAGRLRTEAPDRVLMLKAAIALEVIGEELETALAKPASSPAGGDVGDSVALSMDSDMRNSDFETWACKRGYLMHLHEGDESRRYRYSLTEEAWLGWCAALSQSTSAGRVSSAPTPDDYGGGTGSVLDTIPRADT